MSGFVVLVDSTLENVKAVKSKQEEYDLSALALVFDYLNEVGDTKGRRVLVFAVDDNGISVVSADAIELAAKRLKEETKKVKEGSDADRG